MRPGPLCGPTLAKLVEEPGTGAAWATGAPPNSSAPATAPAPTTAAAAPRGDIDEIIDGAPFKDLISMLKTLAAHF
jgi:hypothetical protein